MFTLQELMTLCKNKLPKLECIKIWNQRCDMDLLTVAESFPDIKEICLYDLQIKDNIVSQLFSKLQKLESVEIENTLINGECLSSIGDKVCSLLWYTDSSSYIRDHLTLSANGKNISSFQFGGHTRNPNDSELIIELIRNEMPNLRKLKLYFDTGVHNYSLLNLKHLQELSVRIDESYGNYKVCQKLNSVKKLFLDVADIEDVNLMSHLSNTPNVQELHVITSRFNYFSLSMIELFSRFQSLKSLTFEDMHFEHKRYHTLQDKSKNALVETIDLLENVTNFSITLGCDENDVYCVPIVNSIEMIAKKRSNQTFVIHFLNANMTYHKFPTNMK
ncbi:hypothetical protein B4U80_14461, partial [Leptotrombidium deliense]